ncbi:MAG: C39 family peptidase [Actinobacteria bacterium]|nr:C39 family peptidase [Actinomycetota bacterium]
MYNRKLLILLAGMMILSSIWPALALATSEINTGALLDAPSSPAEELKWKQATAEKDRLARDAYKEFEKQRKGKVSANATTWLINVTNYIQEKSNWCGPACARQTLSWHKLVSGSSTALPSQSTLASQIGTNSSGSSTAKIADALNLYKTTYSIPDYYIASDIAGYSNPTETFRIRIFTDITSSTTNLAPIVLLATQYLPRYNGASYRHYNTIDGYYDRSPIKMNTVDPHYDSRYSGHHWDPMGSTTVNGVCRAVYKADLAGTNKAMAW